MKTQTSQEGLLTKPWPVDGLESVKTCPVCGETDRSILHSDLVDKVFFVAPGKWTLWQCTQCSSAYLDPQPTRETLHLAYAAYYTHQQPTEKDSYDSLSFVRKLRRRLVNGYTNWRYSTRTEPSSYFGVLVAFAIPSLRKVIDRQYRHLPRLSKQGGTLLDVGCGDGSFLKLAKDSGWDVVGVDPDPKAASKSMQQGLTVYEGGIEYFDGKSNLFDVITLNHVIEHVYEPVKVLKACYALLKPGGQLWVETPNIESYGHERFEHDWRDLDPPRHLVLFNRRSLSQAFVEAGFVTPHDLARPSPCGDVFRASYTIQQGYSMYQALEIPWALRWHAVKAGFGELVFPLRREFLTVTAHKAVD